MIRIAAFGPIRVFRDDSGELALIGQQPKRLALLAYLAAARPRGMQRRDTIVALLWSELDQDRARAALRQTLHALRKSLGAEVIVSDGTETIGLDDRVVRCDLWEFDAVIGSAHEFPDAPLFDGLFLSDAPAFDEWLARERQRVSLATRDSAWASAETALADGRRDQVVHFTRVALGRIEFDEAGLRRGLRLLAAAGERASAIDVFERFATTLRTELEVEPSDETVALATELRRSAPIAAFQPLRRGEVRHAPATRKPRRFAIAATLSVVAVAVAARFAPSASTQIDPRRIHVSPFANETGIAALDTLARSLEIASRTALSALDNATVDARALTNPSSGTEVRGAIRSAGDSLELRAEVVNGASGALVRTVTLRVARGESSYERFNDRVNAAVATWLYPGWGSALSQPPSYTSYRLFLDGMRRIKLEQHEEAMAAFLRAYAEDSSFTASGLLAASELYQMRHFAAADSLVRAITPRRALLPQVDGHLLDWLTQSLAGDRIAARSSMEAIVRIAPSAELAWLQLAIDNVETARPHEAIAALDHLQKNADVTESWVSLWATRAEALHLLHEHTRELAIVREGLRQRPEFRVLVGYELRALAAIGRVDEIDRAITRVEQTREAPQLMRQTAIDLAAHGNEAAGRALLGRSKKWYERRSPVERDSLWYRTGLARTLYLLGENAAARTMYEAFQRSVPKCIDCVGVIGVLAAREGDSATAHASITRLSAVRTAFNFGRNELWTARIAAASGDAPAGASRLHAAFSAGSEFDVLTHADPDLRRLNPDSIYKAFARAPF